VYKIQLKRSAVKELERLPKNAIKHISEAIDSLSVNPRPEGCKKLKGIKEELWRIRVGDYRIIYSIEDVLKIIEIRRIGHRKDIYER
jgi:mRNA interferase RelE/StbE